MCHSLCHNVTIVLDNKNENYHWYNNSVRLNDNDDNDDKEEEEDWDKEDKGRGLRHDREGREDDNGPKRRQMRRLGPRWVFFSFFSSHFMILNNVVIAYTVSNNKISDRGGSNDEN